MLNYNDRKFTVTEKSYVHIEICRDKTSNNCPLRNGSSFDFFFSYTKPVQNATNAHCTRMVASLSFSHWHYFEFLAGINQATMPSQSVFIPRIICVPLIGRWPYFVPQYQFQGVSSHGKPGKVMEFCFLFPGLEKSWNLTQGFGNFIKVMEIMRYSWETVRFGSSFKSLISTEGY